MQLYPAAEASPHPISRRDLSFARDDDISLPDVGSAGDLALQSYDEGRLNVLVSLFRLTGPQERRNLAQPPGRTSDQSKLRAHQWGPAVNKDVSMIEFVKLWLELKVDRRAVTALEYGLIAALIAVVIITGLTTLGKNISNTFTNIAGKI